MLSEARNYVKDLIDESKKCKTYEGSKGQKQLEQLGVSISEMQEYASTEDSD